MILLAAVLTLALPAGCSLGPKNFRAMRHSAPIVRARAVGKGDGRPSSEVVPALIRNLDDTDPVVRLTAHEELRKRTGQDFGFVPWSGPAERQRASTRWRSWWAGPRQAGVAKPGRMP